MVILYIVCAAALIASVIANPKKTKQGVKAGFKLFMKALPSFLSIILVMVVFLYFVPPENIVNVLSRGNEWFNVLVASIIGSIIIVPGFIAFPVAGILKDIGVSYGVLAGLTTSLMMVGVLTFPLEKKYFGKKFAFYRNIASFIIVLIISVVIGLVLNGGAQ